MTALDLLPRYADLGDVYVDPTAAQMDDLAEFKAAFPSAYRRYLDVAAATNLPAILIAGIHWRESSGDFSTYLAQGDPLGKPAIHEPTDQPVRDEWTMAAVDALTAAPQLAARKALDLTAGSTRYPAMLAFAEAYNGTGYAARGVASPYCLAGTNVYDGGKFVADGIFDPNVHDSQVGVLPMLWAAQALIG